MEQLIGMFLMGEGIVSIIKSEDRRFISQVGRALRIAAGIYLIDQGAMFKALGRGVKRLV